MTCREKIGFGLKWPWLSRRFLWWSAGRRALTLPLPGSQFMGEAGKSEFAVLPSGETIKVGLTNAAAVEGFGSVIYTNEAS